MRILFDEIRSNERKSLLVMISFLLFSFLLFGIASVIMGLLVVGDATGIIIFLVIFTIIVVGYVIYFLKNGDKMIMKTTGAVEADRKTYPFLYHTTEALAISAGMKTAPKCYVIKDTALNAYATGFRPENSYIVVTTGLMEKLNRQELEGVLAHEMSHIQNQDIKLMLYVAGLLGVFTLIGTVCYYIMISQGGSKESGKLKVAALVLWLLFSVIGIFFGTLFKLAMSRKREYLADASGATLTRYPPGLASALKKISADPDPLVDKANKATAHLFIATPFRKKKGFLTGMFSTHPPIQDRIARLEQM